MGQEVIPLIKTTSNPTSGNTTSNGYPLGQHWFNETSGVEYVHKSDGVWVEVGSGSAYTHPTGDGNLHVPATSTTNSGKVLTAGATAGSLTWETPASPTPADNTITNAKLAQVATNTIKGRKTAGTGNVEDLTPAEALTLIGAKPSTYNGEFAQKTIKLQATVTVQTVTLKKSTVCTIVDSNDNFAIGNIVGDTARNITIALPPPDSQAFNQCVVYLKIGTGQMPTVTLPTVNEYLGGAIIFSTGTTFKIVFDRIKTGTSTYTTTMSWAKTQ